MSEIDWTATSAPSVPVSEYIAEAHGLQVTATDRGRWGDWSVTGYLGELFIYSGGSARGLEDAQRQAVSAARRLHAVGVRATRMAEPPTVVASSDMEAEREHQRRLTEASEPESGEEG